MDRPFRYRAFISYSHADEAWAKWLHRALETYRVPKHVVGKITSAGPIPNRLSPVFRDREELPTATNLGATLLQALEQSAAQIVICSTTAARSRWVNEEILTFKRLGREHRIFCLIVNGEPGASAHPETASQECFPRALIHRLAPDGSLSAETLEPIAADVRPNKDTRQDAKLKLIAGLLDLGLNELKRREQQRRNRRLALLATASVAGMAVTSTLATTAWLARNEAERERQRATAEAETARQTTRFMVDLFKVSDPSEALGNTITAREILDKGAARISRELGDQPAIQATLMDTMGTVYTSLGLYRSAMPLMQAALEKRRNVFGNNAPESAETLNHLGQVQILAADYAAARRHIDEALEIQRRVHGARSAEVAATLTMKADLLERTGDYRGGEPLIKQALAIQRSIHPGADPAVAASIQALGLNYYQRGDYEPAVTQLREAVAMRRALHGASHPALAEAMNNLAWALFNQGQPAEAERIFRDALAMNRKLLGPAHPDIAAGLNNLAYVLEKRGQLAGAEAVYRESLEMNRKLLGDRHPDVAATMSNLAFVMYGRGAHRQAIDLLRQCLSLRREVLGASHPEVAQSATNLAYWLIEAGALDESTRLAEEGLRIRIANLGELHPQVAGTLIVQANLLLAKRDARAAQGAADHALRIVAAAKLPSDHWLAAAARNAQGAALLQMHHYARAEPLLLGSLDGLKQAPIPDLATRGRAHVVELYKAWGRPDRAAIFAAN